MASIQEIRRRIKAVTNTSQITKAMELVSATKMRRSQEIALLSRPFAVEALRMLGELSVRAPEYVPPLMQKRDIKTTAVVMVSSDRGLAGAFNTNVFRSFEKFFATKYENGTNIRKYENSYIAVGKKAEEFLNRKGLAIHASFKDFGDYAEIEEVKPLTELLVKGFLKGEWDQVVTVSTHFRTTLRQEVLVREILPIDIEKVKATIRELVPEYGRYAGEKENVFGSASLDEKRDFEYLIEPDPKEVMDSLAPYLVEIELYDLILEANASEHSARMVAMKNASENAAELKDELTIEYNKSRQAGITREIAEIVSGAEALRG